MNAAEAMPARCAHCGTLVESTRFCCAGCATAWELLHAAGLGRYYRARTAPGNRPPERDPGWAHIPVSRVGELAEIRFAVDGLHCAACVWVVEHVLTRTAGVDSASVSHATGKGRLRWDPARTDLPALFGAIAAIGYRPRPLGRASESDRGLLLRLGVSSFLAMNVMLLSAALYAGWFEGMDAGLAAFFRWTALALVTPVALWAATPFYRGAWHGLRAGVLHMDLPVSIGIVAMYAHALVRVPAGQESYADSLSMLVTLLLAGRLAEERGRRATVEAAEALGARAPTGARRVEGAAIHAVKADDLVRGDVVEIAAGEEVPADGVVESGSGTVHTALVTGEAEPREVSAGAALVAGTALHEGSVRMRVERTGEATIVRRMARSLAAALEAPPPVTLADRVAPAFTVLTLVLGGVAGVVHGVETMAAVLVVACPCALALASPLAVAVGLGASARRGLLVRGGDALLRLAEVELVALDKTGTLTTGCPAVVDADDAVLRLAAGVERHSGHPVARAVLAACAARGVPVPEGRLVCEQPGIGIAGVVDGERIEVRRGGAGEIEVVGHGRIKLADVLRADAARTVGELHDLGLRSALLSGDREAVVQRISRDAGVETAIAECQPADKVTWIRSAGARVLFVGDGVNDAPALAAAHVGVAMGCGSAVSVLAADALVVGEGLAPVLAGLRAARAVRRAIRRNVARSLAYNALAVSAAMMGLVNPLVAAVLMPLSSLMVVRGAMTVEREVTS